jgi:hypothetical protein
LRFGWLPGSSTPLRFGLEPLTERESRGEAALMVFTNVVLLMRALSASAPGSGPATRHPVGWSTYETRTQKVHSCWSSMAHTTIGGYLYRPPAGSIMGKTAPAKFHTRIIARYSRIGPLASSETKVPADAPRSAGEAALRKRRLPLRIKVPTVKVPADNPYDIWHRKNP